MKIGKWKKRILIASAGLVITLGAGYGAATKTDLFDGRIPARTIVNGKEIEFSIPDYNLIKVPPGCCSLYARKCAEEIFGKHYNPANAWDRRYTDKLICRADNLEEIVEKRILQPGMLVTWKNPNSSHAYGPDKTGNERNCSHVTVYIGMDAGTRELLFAEQRGSKIQVIGYDRFREDKWTPIEVIDSRN